LADAVSSEAASTKNASAEELEKFLGARASSPALRCEKAGEDAGAPDKMLKLQGGPYGMKRSISSRCQLEK